MDRITSVLIATVAVVFVIVSSVNGSVSQELAQISATLKTITERLVVVEDTLKIKVPDERKIIFSDGVSQEVK